MVTHIYTNGYRSSNSLRPTKSPFDNTLFHANDPDRITQPYVADTAPCLCVAAKKILGDAGAAVASDFMDTGNTTTYLVGAHEHFLHAIDSVCGVHGWMDAEFPSHQFACRSRFCLLSSRVRSSHLSAHSGTVPPVQSSIHASCLCRRWRCRT